MKNDKAPQPGQIWKHFKGGTYKIIGIAKNSDNLEDMVIYEALYKNELAQIWARPLSDFLGEKEINNKKINRFELIQK